MPSSTEPKFLPKRGVTHTFIAEMLRAVHIDIVCRRWDDAFVLATSIVYYCTEEGVKRKDVRSVLLGHMLEGIDMSKNDNELLVNQVEWAMQKTIKEVSQ